MSRTRHTTHGDRRLRRGSLVAGLAVTTVAAGLVAAAAPAGAEITTPNPQTLRAVGPVGAYGFPVWYEDADGTKLEQCLDATEALCDAAFLVGEGLDPDLPLHVDRDPHLSNWPGESFYALAESTMPVTGGDATFVSALEATFAGEEARDGEQVVFGRIRIRVDTPVAGRYVVTHPYGVDTFTVAPGSEGDGINMTQDVFAAPQDFGQALKSRVAPFLERAGGRIEQPDGDVFLGDPGETTRVVGSPLGTDYFEVAGPAGTVRNELFTVMGKVSTNSGVEADAVYYSETEDGQVLVDAYATAGENDAVELSGAGLPETTMAADGTGYFARVAASSVPETVTITNTSDRPAAVKTVPVVDNVQVTNATYDDGKLTVAARSSDHDAVLSYGEQALTGGSLTVEGLRVPPVSVTVTSDGGGSDTAPVMVLGAEAGQAVAQTAVIAGPLTANLGSPVTLSAGSSVNATGYSWSGPDVDGRATADVTVQPAEPGTYTYTVTTTGPGGQVTSEPHVLTVLAAEAEPTVTVQAPATAPEVGASVTLTATATNDASFRWTQPEGQAVQTTDPRAKSITFTMPRTAVTFTAEVTSPTGTVASQTVTVTPNGDTLTVTAAELRTGKNEWRVTGTATNTTLNTVRVYLQNTNDSKGALVGEGGVDATGAWTVRSRGVVGASPTGLLYVESTKGGLQTGQTYTTRR